MAATKILSTKPSAVKARQARIDQGLETEAAAKAFSKKVSLQSAIQLPLLAALEENGGSARPRELYDAIADNLSIDQGARDERRPCAAGEFNVFQQQVRWARQTAVAEGLISGEKGVWELTDAGYSRLGKIRRGKAIMIYRTSDGIALWAHAEDAASVIEPGSVKLVMTSPPYPVVKRAYGRFTVPEWLEWMKHLAGIWKSLLAEDGTIAVNLMDVFVGGSPMLSPYVERFTLAAIDDVGLNLAGRMMWHSPTKLGNIEWTSRRKVTPKNTLEHLLLFSRSSNPDWDITRMERGNYSAGGERARANDAARPRKRRVSGLDLEPGAFWTGDGPLPGNLITAGGVSGSDGYSRRCKAEGLEAHPARFPEVLPRQTILLTTAPGDVVYDPMAGSNTVGKVASELGRRFISSDPMLEYVRGSAFRFDHRPDFQAAGLANAA